MSRKAIVWILFAVMMILSGSILFTGAMTIMNWDFRKLSTARYETHEYTFSEHIEHLRVDTVTADVMLVPSESNEVTVVCREQEHINHDISIQNGTLVIEANDTRKWYEHIQLFSFETPKITVSLPAGTYNTLTVTATTGDIDVPKDFSWQFIDISATTGDVHCEASTSGAMNIHLTTGDIDIRNASAESADLKVTTGDILINGFVCKRAVNIKAGTGEAQLIDVTCGSFSSDGTTGNLILKNVIATESFDLKRSTGDITFERCDARNINAKVTTGDITGTLLSDKIFSADVTTGHTDVPNSASGGTCTLHATTGDIRIEIVK